MIISLIKDQTNFAGVNMGILFRSGSQFWEEYANGPITQPHFFENCIAEYGSEDQVCYILPSFDDVAHWTEVHP